MDQNEIDVDHLLSDRIEHTPSKKAKLQTEGRRFFYCKIFYYTENVE